MANDFQLTNIELMDKLMKVAYANDISKDELALKIGFDRATLYAYLAAKRKISPRMKFKIERFLEKYLT